VNYEIICSLYDNWYSV